MKEIKMQEQRKTKPNHCIKGTTASPDQSWNKPKEKNSNIKEFQLSHVISINHKTKLIQVSTSLHLEKSDNYKVISFYYTTNTIYCIH